MNVCHLDSISTQETRAKAPLSVFIIPNWPSRAQFSPSPSHLLHCRYSSRMESWSHHFPAVLGFRRKFKYGFQGSWWPEAALSPAHLSPLLLLCSCPGNPELCSLKAPGRVAWGFMQSWPLFPPFTWLTHASGVRLRSLSWSSLSGFCNSIVDNAFAITTFVISVMITHSSVSFS